MNDLTLKELFFSQQGSTGDVVGENLEADDELLVALESDIKEQLPKLSWKMVQKEMSAKIGEVLNVGLGDVLAAAWGKVQELQEYADPEQHPPDEVVLVPLAPHTIESSHSPHVDLLIKKITIGSLHLDVALKVELEGVVLQIQGGRIREVRAGSGHASGQLQCRVESRVGTKEILSLERETPKLELEHGWKLGEDGISIAVPLPEPVSEGVSELVSELKTSN